MSAKEMYDYLDVVTPNNNQTLAVSPQRVVVEEGFMNQTVNEGLDGSEEIITHSTSKIFYVTLQWPVISESGAGTIMQFYFDAAYGNGIAETFKWTHPSDGHTYVVRFTKSFRRTLKTASIFGIESVELKVLGKVADA